LDGSRSGDRGISQLGGACSPDAYNFGVVLRIQNGLIAVSLLAQKDWQTRSKAVEDFIFRDPER
jgi:hypothetical protein